MKNFAIQIDQILYGQHFLDILHKFFKMLYDFNSAQNTETQCDAVLF